MSGSHSRLYCITKPMPMAAAMPPKNHDPVFTPDPNQVTVRSKKP